MRPRLRLDQWLLACVLCVLLLLGAMGNTSTSTKARTIALQRSQPNPILHLLVPAPVPWQPGRSLGVETPKPKVTAQAYTVIDLLSASILIEQGSENALPPASTVKLLTALVALDSYDLNQVLPIASASAAQGTVVGFTSDDLITVRDLIAASLIRSGNDAALALAYSYPEGGEQGFVAAMQKKGEELHLSSSRFDNPVGYDSDQLYMSVRDLAIVARAVLLEPELAELVRTTNYTVLSQNNAHRYQIESTHQLLGKTAGVIGVKTGTTDGAGEVLVTAVERPVGSILIVVMGSEDRYGDTLQLMNWVYDTFSWTPALEL